MTTTANGGEDGARPSRERVRETRKREGRGAEGRGGVRGVGRRPGAPRWKQEVAEGARARATELLRDEGEEDDRRVAWWAGPATWAARWASQVSVR